MFRKVMFIVVMLNLLSVSLIADGRYSLVSNSSTYILRPSPGGGSIWRPATQVVRGHTGFPYNQWDYINSSIGWMPYPWNQLYNLDNAWWIGLDSLGNDSSYAVPQVYRFMSPVIILPPSGQAISRATIWLASDDTVYFKVGTAGDPTFHQAGFRRTDFRRIDMTEVLRSFPAGSSPRFYFYVADTCLSYMGLIYYFSLDYGLPTRTLTYADIRAGWNFISLPLYTYGYSGNTIRDLFSPFVETSPPDTFVIVPFPYGNHYFSINASLKGPIGDTLRTYSFWLKSTRYVPSYTISGIPIYEQRFLNDSIDAYHPIGTVWNAQAPFPDLDDDDPPGSVAYWLYWDALNRVWRSTTTHSAGVGYLALFLSSTKVTHYTLRATPVTLSGENILADPSILGGEIAIPQPPGPPEIVTRPGFGRNSYEDNTVTNERVKIKIFPNPFNSFVIIECEAHNEFPINLSIYDITGRKIKELMNRNAFSSEQYTWDGRDENGQTVSSGIYFLRVETQSGTVTKVITFIK